MATVSTEYQGNKVLRSEHGVPRGEHGALRGAHGALGLTMGYQEVSTEHQVAEHGAAGR